MASPKYYHLEVLENNSRDSLAKLVLIFLAACNGSGADFDDERDYDDGELVSFKLKNEEPFDWLELQAEMLYVSKLIPDVCFCVTEFPTEDVAYVTQCRHIFYNGKCVTQEPEIIYPHFSINNFEYETSDKIALPVNKEDEFLDIINHEWTSSFYESRINFQKLQKLFENFGFTLVKGNPSHPTFVNGFSILKGRDTLYSELDWFGSGGVVARARKLLETKKVSEAIQDA